MIEWADVGTVAGATVARVSDGMPGGGTRGWQEGVSPAKALGRWRRGRQGESECWIWQRSGPGRDGTPQNWLPALPPLGLGFPLPSPSLTVLSLSLRRSTRRPPLTTLKPHPRRHPLRPPSTFLAFSPDSPPRTPHPPPPSTHTPASPFMRTRSQYLVSLFA